MLRMLGISLDEQKRTEVLEMATRQIRNRMAYGQRTDFMQVRRIIKCILCDSREGIL